MRNNILLFFCCLLTTSTFSQTKEEEMINQLTERIAADPTNAELYVMRGMIWAEIKQWKKSIPDLGKALSLVAEYSKSGKPSRYFSNDPLDSSKIINMRAICYGELDMLDSAISDFRFLQQRHPKHFYYIVAVAQLYIDKKLFDNAQAELNLIKKDKESEERTLSCQAILFLEQ